MSKTEKALAKFTIPAVKKYMNEHLTGMEDAKRKILDLCITEALQHAHGWEDLLHIMRFQHCYKAYKL